MKRTFLKDYSGIYELIDPVSDSGEIRSEKPIGKGEEKDSVYCFDIQVKAINLTLYNRLVTQEQNMLIDIENTIAMKDVFSLREDEDQIRRRQRSVVKRLK
ncbi:MAG: hypothetical protein ACHQRM_17250, partial [Bacteroidia bacterium]